MLVGVAPPAGPEAEPGAAQLELCDRIRDEARLPVVLVDPRDGADGAATAMLSGRADLVLGAPSLCSQSWAPTAVELVAKPAPA
ncbi:MAG TPA: hypothetical protein VGI73_06450 [Solirubrobacterales bacterium]